MSLAVMSQVNIAIIPQSHPVSNPTIMYMLVAIMCPCLWDRQIQVQRISIPFHISSESCLTKNNLGLYLE